jgi:hypothetical protein
MTLMYTKLILASLTLLTDALEENLYFVFKTSKENTRFKYLMLNRRLATAMI